MNCRIYQVLSVLLLVASTSFSQIIAPDLNFGNQGSFVHDVNTNEDVFSDLVRQPDGKLVAAGYSIQQATKEITLMRLNANGTADSTFGQNGFVEMNAGIIHSYAKAVCLQQDGKILVAGYYDNNFYNDALIARFNTDGTPDSTFGNAGLITYVMGNQYDEFHDIAVQPDGKIVVGGRTWQNNSYDFIVMRLFSDGNPDTLFGVNGIATTDFNGNYDCITSLILLPGNRIVVSGHTEIGASYFAAAKYLNDGSLDVTFGTNGKISIGSGSRLDRCYGMTMVADSSLILAGRHHNSSIDELMLVKLSKTGVPDSTFGTAGVRMYPTVHASDVLNDIVTQADDKLVACGKGDGNNAMVMRFLPDGTPDNTFGNQGTYSGNNGGVQAGLNALILLPDQSFVGAGFVDNGNNFDFLVTKVLNNVSTSVSEPVSRVSFRIYPNPVSDVMHIETGSEANESTTVIISDVSGRKIFMNDAELVNGELQLNLPVSVLPGIYTLTLHNSSFSSSSKFIRQ